MVEWETLPVAFRHGLDTRTNYKHVIQGKWTTLNNYTLGVDGSLNRRPGVSPLIGSVNGNGLATHNNELCVINGKSLSAVALGNVGIGTTAIPGQVGNVGVSKSAICKGQFYADSMDCATCTVASGNSLTAYVWLQINIYSGATNSINACIVDESTGSYVLTPTQLANVGTEYCPRVVFVNDSGIGAFIFMYPDGAGNIQANVVDLLTPTTVGAKTAIITTANSTLPIDAMTWVTTSAALLVQDTVAAVQGTRLAKVVRAGTVPSVSGAQTLLFSDGAAPRANITCFALCRQSVALGAAFIQVSGTGVLGSTFSASFAQVTASTNIDAVTTIVAGQSHITAVGTAAGFSVFYDQAAASNTLAVNPVVRTTSNSTLGALVTTTIAFSATYAIANYIAVPATAPAGMQGPFIIGKAFSYGASAQIYLPMMTFDTYGLSTYTAASPQLIDAQNTVVILDGNTGLVAARALYGTYGGFGENIGGGSPPRMTTPCSTPAIGSSLTGPLSLAVGEQGTLTLVNGTNRTYVGVSRLLLTPEVGADDFGTPTCPLSAQLGQTTYLTGGILRGYDGKQVSEPGFQFFPEGVTGFNATPGTGLGLSTGVHQIVAVYEWQDGAGNRHQSQASVPFSLTVANTTDVMHVFVPDLQLPPAAVANNPSLSTCNIVLYMTAAGLQTFYRVVDKTFANGAYTPNVPGQTFSTLLVGFDTPMTDATLTANEPLYQQPAIANFSLPNQLPGPCSAMCAHQNRLFIDQTDNPLAFAFSQPYIPNVGLQWNQALGGTLPAESGGIVGIAPLDDKVVFFCANRLYVVFGTGPRIDGTFSNYSDPQLIPSTVGCADARSVVATSEGLLFKSKTGWHVLGRDLSVTYIGAGAKAYDANAVSACVVKRDRQEVHIYSPTTAAPTLVYSFLDGQWSTLSYASAYSPSCAAWWGPQNSAVHVSTSAGLNFDDTTKQADQIGTAGGGLPFVTTATTAPLNLGLLEGFVRVRRIYVTGSAAVGTGSASTVNITVTYDDSGASSYTVSLDLSLTPTATTNGVVDWSHRLRTQKCKSVAFSITETNAFPPTMTGLQALALEVGRKRGVKKLPASQVAP